MACPCCSASRCPVCPGKTCQIDWPADGAFIDGVGYNKKGAGTYYSKAMSGIEFHPQFPAWLGYSGSSKTQSLWKVGTVAGPQIPAPPVPEYTWNAGYPADLQNCAYWVADSTRTVGYGTDCCQAVVINPVTGEMIGCDRRGALGADKGKFKWRLMLLDCNSESLTDITDAAITKIGIFEGTFNQFLQPYDRGCATQDFIALPDYFNTPAVVCA